MLVIIGVVVLIAAGFFLSQKKEVAGPSIVTPQRGVVKIATSFPMRGNGTSIINGITLALEEAGNKVGDYDVKLVVGDDADEKGAWQPNLEKDNAQKAAADPDVMAYLGTYNSGAAKLSIPITNAAGLVQISPGNTYPGLTQAGFAPDEPGIYYPTGVRSYFRICTTDAMQGPAAMVWMKELGTKSIYVLHDGETTSKSDFNTLKKIDEIGLKVVGRAVLDNTDFGISKALSDFKKSGADTLYYNGIIPKGIIPLLKGLRAENKTAKVISLDGIMDPDLIKGAGAAAEGVHVTTVGFSPDKLTTEQGKEFVKKYVARFKVQPEVFSSFGYEAAKVALMAIEKGGKDRAKVLAQVAGTKDYNGLFGTWSFDQNGDTTLKLISGNTVKDGQFVFEKVLDVK